MTNTISPKAGRLSRLTPHVITRIAKATQAGQTRPKAAALVGVDCCVVSRRPWQEDHRWQHEREQHRRAHLTTAPLDADTIWVRSLPGRRTRRRLSDHPRPVRDNLAHSVQVCCRVVRQPPVSRRPKHYGRRDREDQEMGERWAPEPGRGDGPLPRQESHWRQRRWSPVETAAHRTRSRPASPRNLPRRLPKGQAVHRSTRPCASVGLRSNCRVQPSRVRRAGKRHGLRSRLPTGLPTSPPRGDWKRSTPGLVHRGGT